MVDPALPLVQSYHPATFLERGAAVPFTTPLLAGTRARPGERDGTEMVVPNPSGGRGVYILPLSRLHGLCQPTVHDRRLLKKAAALSRIGPASIRDAARQVASEGLAGPAARQAALAAAETDRRDRLTTHFHLLMLLIGQVMPGPAGAPETAQKPHPGLRQRAREAVVLMAARLGQPADTVAAGLEALADLFVATGLPGDAGECRIPRLLRSLHRVHDEVAAWRGRNGEHSGACCADLVITAAGLTLSCTRTTLAEARAPAADLAALLRDQAAAVEKIARLVARPEWLLDGWDRICALWDDAADPSDRAAALVEMAQLVPVLPQETAAWIGTAAATEPLAVFRRKVELNEDWRTGAAVFGLIARNERLRAWDA